MISSRNSTAQIYCVGLLALGLVGCSFGGDGGDDVRPNPVAANLSAPERGNAVLDVHNRARAAHGAAPLRWSGALAAEAQNWANGCNFEHSGQPGENLAHGTASAYSPADLVQLWYEEGRDYDYASGRAKYPGAVTGHFTQVVWEESRELGCGVANCPQLGNYLVCRYEPFGNVRGRYVQNVALPR